MANSKRRCLNCKQYFVQDIMLRTPIGFFHTHGCATEYAQSKRQALKKKKTAIDTREQKEKLKTVKDWLSDAQKVMNQYARVRDEYKPCISCGRHHQGQYHGGHYRTVAAASSIRFNVFNINKQCMPCNHHKSGNAVEYRINLVKKYGIEKVEWLESQNEVVRYDIDWLKRLIKVFRKKIRLYKRLFREDN